MSQYPVHVTFHGRLVFVGFGSIGQGVLPLILRHVRVSKERITIVTAEEAQSKSMTPNLFGGTAAAAAVARRM